MNKHTKNILTMQEGEIKNKKSLYNAIKYKEALRQCLVMEKSITDKRAVLRQINRVEKRIKKYQKPCQGLLIL